MLAASTPRLWAWAVRSTSGAGYACGARPRASQCWVATFPRHHAAELAMPTLNPHTNPISATHLGLGSESLLTLVSTRRRILIRRPTLGFGSEKRVPRSTCLRRTPYCSCPSGPVSTSTFSTVALPQRGQNRRPISCAGEVRSRGGSVRKQGRHAMQSTPWQANPHISLNLLGCCSAGRKGARSSAGVAGRGRVTEGWSESIGLARDAVHAEA